MDICEQVFNDLSYLARILKIVNPAVDITTVVVAKGNDGDGKEIRASSGGGAAIGDMGGFDRGETSPGSAANGLGDGNKDHHDDMSDSAIGIGGGGGSGGVDLGICESKSSSAIVTEENGGRSDDNGEGSGNDNGAMVIGTDHTVFPVSPEEKHSPNPPLGDSSQEPSLTANSIDPPPASQRHNAIRFLRELFYLTRSLPIDRRSDLYHRMLMQLSTQVQLHP